MDVPTVGAARALADRLGDSVSFYKLGLELFMSGDAFALLDWTGRARQEDLPRPQALRRAGDGRGRGAEPRKAAA